MIAVLADGMEYRRVPIKSIIIHRGFRLHIRSRFEQNCCGFRLAELRSHVQQRRAKQWGKCTTDVHAMVNQGRIPAQFRSQ